MSASGPPTGDGAPRLLRIVRGEPTDAEVAALTVVLAAAAGAAQEAQRPQRPLWGDPAAHHRRMPVAGASAWRTTYWPR